PSAHGWPPASLSSRLCVAQAACAPARVRRPLLPHVLTMQPRQDSQQRKRHVELRSARRCPHSVDPGGTSPASSRRRTSLLATPHRGCLLHGDALRFRPLRSCSHKLAIPAKGANIYSSRKSAVNRRG